MNLLDYYRKHIRITLKNGRVIEGYASNYDREEEDEPECLEIEPYGEKKFIIDITEKDFDDIKKIEILKK